MSDFAIREVDVRQLPLGKTTLLHPERCVVKIGKDTIDLGALCYRKRSTDARQGKIKARGVDLNSFERARTDKVRRLIKQFSLEVQYSGRQEISIAGHSSCIVRFVDWCDQEGHAGLFGNEQEVRQTFRAYMEHLRHRVDTNGLSNNTAAGFQNYALLTLSEFFGIDDLAHGVRLLNTSRRAASHTPPPDEESQGKVLSLCEMIFDGIATHVLQHNPYPIKLDLPGYLGWKENALWMFPVTKYFMAPHEIAIRGEMKNGYWAYDYAGGRYFTKEEMRGKYHNESALSECFTTAQELLTHANEDRRYGARIHLALLAHNCFVLRFVANTGMNWAVARKLPWSNDYEVGAERLGFREIKFRAKRKLVSFEIQSVFLKPFKRFLALRELLLGGRSCHTLFFSFGLRARQKPRPIAAELLVSLFDTLRRIDPSLPRILARKWRAAKSDWSGRHHDISTTAMLLSNTEATVKQSYLAGSETRAIEEMGNFYGKIREIVLEADVTPEGGAESFALGSCKDYGHPIAATANPRIAPDCHQEEGCLFCEHYVVHADERDIRKLLSARTCIYRTTHLSKSDEHFDSLFGEVLKRIQAIIDHINAISDDMARLVERIRLEVEDQWLLDIYWERKMQLLINVGVVSA